MSPPRIGTAAGEHLTTLALNICGLPRLRGEPDGDLRARCLVRLANREKPAGCAGCGGPIPSPRGIKIEGHPGEFCCACFDRAMGAKPAACSCGLPLAHTGGPFTLDGETYCGNCWHTLATRAEKRRAREAPLVALVAAVPAWAEPVAWRAAVLSAWELWGTAERIGTGRAPEQTSFTDWAASYFVGFGEYVATSDSAGNGPADAYRRALTPAAKVAPERRDRGPAVVCDNGSDDE